MNASNSYKWNCKQNSTIMIQNLGMNTDSEIDVHNNRIMPVALFMHTYDQACISTHQFWYESDYTMIKCAWSALVSSNPWLTKWLKHRLN